MADTLVRNWSDLPSDLLIRILGRLNARIYLFLFRAVCPAWRSALPLSGDGCPLHHNWLRLPSDLVSKKQEKIFFLVSSPQNQLHKWVIHVEEAEGNRWSFFNPLTGDKFYFPYQAKTEQFNLLDYRITELGRSHTLQLRQYSPRFKFLVCSSPALKCPSVLFRLSRKVLFFQSELEKWVKFGPGEAFDEDPGFINAFEDIVSFKGRFYAADKKGRLVMFDPLRLQEPVSVVTCPLNIDRGSGVEIFLNLVESEGSLYLVVRRRVESDDLQNEDSDYPKKLQVFVLTEEEGRDAKWDEVGSIGDRVFLIGQDATFSVSSSTSVMNKANCIYFGVAERWVSDAGIYDLDTDEPVQFNGSADPDSHARLFWPPPSWICDWDPDIDPHVWMFDWGPEVDPDDMDLGIEHSESD